MIRLSLLALVVSPLVLSACTTTPQPPSDTQASGAGPAHRNGQLDFELASGSYSCEYGLNVHVRREVHAHVNTRIHVGWNGRSYQLERDPSHSGLPRFEDVSSGLVWIDLPWKGVLLEGKTHKPLANECRAA
ncbi:MAG: hypothetical protein Q7J47_20585 [Azoarcus sp.]|nr:hypothetical protein [Azoarcus sp.]